MVKLHSYLNFDGNAEEAMNFYKSVFGGEFTSIVRFREFPMPGVTFPEEDGNKIMHMGLKTGKEDLVLASDIIPSIGQKLVQGNNTYIFVEVESKEEADRIYNKLSENGIIEMQIMDQPWGDYYGAFRDKFGIQWMIDYARQELMKEMVIDRIFNAHRDLVWKAWTEPERTKEWWRTQTYTIPVANIEFRFGSK